MSKKRLINAFCQKKVRNFGFKIRNLEKYVLRVGSIIGKLFQNIQNKVECNKAKFHKFGLNYFKICQNWAKSVFYIFI